ncbi:MAG: hypothetical protein AB3N63_10310 [Puniceicoccaceae bacterium]
MKNNYKSTGAQRRETGSKSFLALPLPPAGEVDWVSSWAIMDPPEGSQLIKRMDNTLAADSMPIPDLEIEEGTFVSFFGYIEENDARIYCLYDEQDQRWFRLPVGQVDEVSQLKAEWSAEDGVACLLNLKTGVRYRVKPGERELERVAFD